MLRKHVTNTWSQLMAKPRHHLVGPEMLRDVAKVRCQKMRPRRVVVRVNTVSYVPLPEWKNKRLFFGCIGRNSAKVSVGYKIVTRSLKEFSNFHCSGDSILAVVVVTWLVC